MSPASGKRCRTAAAIAVVFAIARVAQAADLLDLVRETQRFSNVAQQLTMVWWIPQEFWELSMSGSPDATPEGRAQVIATLEDYQIVALLRAKAGIGTITDVQPRTNLLNNAWFEIGGKVIEPVAPEAITPGAQVMLGALKPALAGVLGTFGHSIELVIYPAKQGNVRLIDPSKVGSFQYTLYDQTFRWRMPLGSLLPKKFDPKTDEEFPGNYQYNPFTGGKLGTK
jgi:hypothetical protein